MLVMHIYLVIQTSSVPQHLADASIPPWLLDDAISPLVFFWHVLMASLLPEDWDLPFSACIGRKKKGEFLLCDLLPQRYTIYKKYCHMEH